MLQAHDHELMLAIARRRDERAFEELYRRYLRQAFAVAYHVSGSREAAEEGVQLGMVRIWEHAAHFTRTGSARAWILRLVARETLKLLRKSFRSARRENEYPGGAAADLAVPDLRGENAEWIPGFQKVFGQLPHLDRKLLALYYAAGLKQAEVAHELGITQRTVSNRLKRALQVLRVNLTKAGFAATWPAATAEALGEALCSGFEPPAGLHGRISHALQGAPRTGFIGSASRIGHTASSVGNPALATAGALFAVSAAVVAWWASPPAGDPPAPVLAGREAGRGVSPPDSPLQASERAAGAQFFARWTFENGPPKDIFAAQGVWRWKPGALGKGEMCSEAPLDRKHKAAPDSPVVTLLLPQTMPRHPVAIEVDAYVPKIQNGFVGVDAYWTDLRGHLPHRRWSKIGKVATSNHQFQSLLHLVGPYVINRINGRIASIWEFRSPYPADRITLVVERVTITAITLRTLNPAERDGDLRDVPATIRGMGLVPSEFPFAPFLPSTKWGGSVE